MHRRHRGGFSLIEILIAMAIAVVLAALVAPNIAGALDRARIERATDELELIRDGVSAFEDDVGEVPGAMSHLAEPIGGADADICGDGYNGGEQNRWSGPYLDRVLPAAGLQISVGTVSNAFVRIAQPGAADWLAVQVTGVEEGDALVLDEEIDGGDGMAAASIQWTAPDADGFVTLSFIFPVTGC